MVILRLTQKIQKRLGSPFAERFLDEGEGTTVLGDWYVNLVRCGREQLVLYTSSTTRLSVVCPARGLARSIDGQLRRALEDLLREIGVDEGAIRRELAEMRLVVYANTADRSVLGTMTEFAFMIQFSREREPERPLSELGHWLSSSPCRAGKEHWFPDARAVTLLGGELRSIH